MIRWLPYLVGCITRMWEPTEVFELWKAFVIGESVSNGRKDFELDGRHCFGVIKQWPGKEEGRSTKDGSERGGWGVVRSTWFW